MLFKLAALAAAVSAANIPTYPPHNDFSCRSASHPNPVVLLHGLGATWYEDLYGLELYLKAQGFCTFSLTYGNPDGFPFVGGLKPIDQSADQIAAFVKEVQSKTGASKVDLVGHSEGGFQSLYVPKVKGVSGIVDNIVAIAPPTHGTTFAGLLSLAKLLNLDPTVDAALKTFGCTACNDLGGEKAAIKRLNDGTPIKQAGNTITVIISKYDELVTPTTTAFIDEDGVNNIYVQDYCPIDPVGHIGEAGDTNVFNLVLNSLENQVGRKFICFAGPPGK